MKDLQLFNFENQKVRTVEIDGEPGFVGKDVATILGYSNTRDALAKHIDDEDKKDGVAICDSIGREQKAVVINESGVYSLIFASKMPNAKRFKHWVTSEVLPAIRKTGSYQLPQTPEEKLQLTMQAASHLDKRMTKVEKDIQHIKDVAEVDERQRYQLLQARKKRVIEAVGGMDSNFYVEKKSKKVFAEFSRDFKKAFQIPRYDCLKKKDFAEGIKFTNNWYPSFPLQREIQIVNAQQTLKLDQELKNERIRQRQRCTKELIEINDPGNQWATVKSKYGEREFKVADLAEMNTDLLAQVCDLLGMSDIYLEEKTKNDIAQEVIGMQTNIDLSELIQLLDKGKRQTIELKKTLQEINECVDGIKKANPIKD